MDVHIVDIFQQYGRSIISDYGYLFLCPINVINVGTEPPQIVIWIFTKEVNMKEFNMIVRIVLNGDTEPPSIPIWLLIKNICLKKLNMIVYKKYDQCRHLASSNNNVSVHKQTMYEGVPTWL